MLRNFLSRGRGGEETPWDTFSRENWLNSTAWRKETFYVEAQPVAVIVLRIVGTCICKPECAYEIYSHCDAGYAPFLAVLPCILSSTFLSKRDVPGFCVRSSRFWTER